jgi:thiamine-phosphate pyrophosphorylase
MSEKQKVDYSLYLVTDRALSLGRSNLEVIEAAVNGGVTLVQLREKEASTQEFYQEGLKIKDYLKAAHIPLIINDRIDIALALDADGVHLGQEDMPVDVARKILGQHKIIGASAFTRDEAVAAESMGADYLGLSPIFVTTTKAELAAEIGMEGIYCGDWFHESIECIRGGQNGAGRCCGGFCYMFPGGSESSRPSAQGGSPKG